MTGTSRMNREVHVRICGRLEVKFLRSTRRVKIPKRRPEEMGTEALKQVVQLMSLCGIDKTSAWVFVMEFFSWRGFRNRREVGAWPG
jgi:transposase